MPAFETIDSHIHFWKLSRGDYTALRPDMGVLHADHLPEHLAPELDSVGVGRIVVVQAAETVAETRFTLALARRTPFIAGVVGWIDPASRALGDELDALTADPRLKGVRPVRDDNASVAWMADPALAAGYDAIAARGLSLDVLVQRPDEIPVVTALADRHPSLTIVLDHCGKPDIAEGRFEPWGADIAALARRRNTVCKFSGLLSEAARGSTAGDLRRYANHVLAVFGPGRLLWGSDWPPLKLMADYRIWWRVAAELLAGLDAEDRALVMGGTAARIYRL